MPAQNQSFSQGLRQIAGELLPLLRPELARALASGAGLVALCLLLALFPAEETGGTADLAGAVAIAALLMGNAHSMIRMAAETVTEMSEYEKLLLPVVTAAMAAQGGVNSATALYAAPPFSIRCSAPCWESCCCRSSIFSWVRQRQGRRWEMTL